MRAHLLEVGAGPCVPGWQPHPVTEVGGCHPAGSLLELAGGRGVRIEDVRVGTPVLTPSGYEPVVGRLHAEPIVSREYFEIVTSRGVMSISPLHWLYVNGSLADPAGVRPGDWLTAPDDTRAEVLSVRRTLREGAYHITTPSGAYYVDGHLASTYMAVVPHWAWRLFGDGYVRLRHRLGVPVTRGPKTAQPFEQAPSTPAAVNR